MYTNNEHDPGLCITIIQINMFASKASLQAQQKLPLYHYQLSWEYQQQLLVNHASEFPAAILK
jgi:hypothetical protein